VTVATLLADHWLPTVAKRPSTVENYRQVCEAWIVPRIGGLSLAALTKRHVRDLYDGLLTNGSRLGRGGLSPRSVQLAGRVLNMALNYAVSQGFVSRNVAAGVNQVRPARKRPGAWTSKEAGHFLASVETDRLYCLWLLLLARGLRRGEACGLRWSDVDLTRGRISVHRTIVLVNGKPIGSEPKTDAGRRTVPIDGDLVSELLAHRARQGMEETQAGEAWANSQHIFTDELGQPLHPEWLSTRWETLVRRSGVRPLHLHGARHTAATLP
jgi:integrase